MGLNQKQLDIIVTTDTAPRFEFHNKEGDGKAFSPVEGALGAFSIKSHLDKRELLDALDGIASIPPTRPLVGRANPLMRLNNYDDWPLKVIYATNGIAGETLQQHLIEYYAANPSILLTRRPNYVHVAGKYLFARATPNIRIRNTKAGIDLPLTVGKYYGITADVDLIGLAWPIHELQLRATASNHINYSYANIINNALGVLPLVDSSPETTN